MGYESVHTASATGDDQELRRCIEGLDVDRDGLFNRHDPKPRVVVGREPGSHGRFNKPTPAAVRGSLGDTALHKAAMAGQTVSVGYLLSVAASGGLTAPVDGGLGPGLDGDDAYRAELIRVAVADAQDADGTKQPNVGAGRQVVEVEGARQLEGARQAEGAMQVLARLVNARNDAGQTALHCACLHGNYTCAQMLLAAKSDIQATDLANGYTPLHGAVRRGHVRIVALLLDAGADPNAPDLQGSSPLHVAARYNVASGVRLLAGSGAMLDGQRSQDHYTALHLACRYNDTPDTVVALLDARADPTLLSRGGQPAALIAATLGDPSVLEAVSEVHWRLCLENPDGEGLSRIKGGGSLTARAVFDKVMQRKCWEMTLPDEQGRWYHAASEYQHSWKSQDANGNELTMQIPLEEPGVECGKWVAAGPLGSEALEDAISAASTEAHDLFKSKVSSDSEELKAAYTSSVSSFTPAEKVEELVSIELSGPTRLLRTANEHWWSARNSARRAREAFDFKEAEKEFKGALKCFAADWWGADGANAATTLVHEMIRLHDLKSSLDARMQAGDNHRNKFDFKEAEEAYAGVGEQYGSYGHSSRAFEAYYRLSEVRRKKLLRQEAEACVNEATRLVLTATPQEEYPYSRLMIAEALANLKRACKIYKSYADMPSYVSTKARLTATTWNLEKQTKAYAHLEKGNMLMSWVSMGAAYERRADTNTLYTPTDKYAFPATVGGDERESEGSKPRLKMLQMLQIEEASAELKSSLMYLADIGDQKVQALASANYTEAMRLLAIQRQAHRHMQVGQEEEVRFCLDVEMQGKVVVFGQVPSVQDSEALCVAGCEGEHPFSSAGWREPYRRHAVPDDYAFIHAQHGTIYHRKMVEEAMEAYRMANGLFAQLPDEENRLEAERQELRLVELIRKQKEGHALFGTAHAHVLNRQYADACEKFKAASVLLSEILDAQNAAYLQELSEDAGAKHSIATSAHAQMREGQELLEKREAFERWEDVVNIGLQAFASAEALFKRASDLFADLDEADNARKAYARMEESCERKIHAEEIKASYVIVVQGSGDYAPERRDTYRRTMAYASAEQAIKDTATNGYTSTYHTPSHILEGSTVYLRQGVHEFLETMQIVRSVAIRAQEGVKADDCKIVIKERSLLHSVAASVKLYDVTVEQLLGDGAEDYWSGGLYVIMATQGYIELCRCFVYSQRGCGVVVRHSGKAMLQSTIVDCCGQYGVAADGVDALIDLRDCSVQASKFEDTDQRNGARVVGYTDSH